MNLKDSALLATISQTSLLLPICYCSWCEVCFPVWNFPTLSFQQKEQLPTFCFPSFGKQYDWSRVVSRLSLLIAMVHQLTEKFSKCTARGKNWCTRQKNPYSDDNRDIYFYCDVPHLIKTTRNCWSNSFGHKQSRALWVGCTCM